MLLGYGVESDHEAAKGRRGSSLRKQLVKKRPKPLMTSANIEYGAERTGGAMETENRKLVERFFNAMSEGRADDAFALVAEDAKWWVPGTLPFSGTKSKSEYLGIVRRIEAGFPNGLRFEVKSTTAEGDRVAAEVESLGQHVNGRTYNNRYHFLIVIRNGQFVRISEYMDTLHLKDLLS
jgi:ketosteroid isomerase-like protein